MPSRLLLMYLTSHTRGNIHHSKTSLTARWWCNYTGEQTLSLPLEKVHQWIFDDEL